MQFERLVYECIKNIERKVAFYDSSKHLLSCVDADIMTACVCFAIFRVCEANDDGLGNFRHFLDQRSGIEDFCSSLENAGYITEDESNWDCNFAELRRVAIAVFNEITPWVQCRQERRKRG